MDEDGAVEGVNILPPIFILPSHLSQDELAEVEDRLLHLGGELTYDATEARIFLGKVTQKKRAAFDLRSRGVWTEEVDAELYTSRQLSKRRRLNSEDRGTSEKARLRSQTVSDSDITGSRPSSPEREKSDGLRVPKRKTPKNELVQKMAELNHVLVLKLDWLDESLKKKSIFPLEQFTVYMGKVISKPLNDEPLNTLQDSPTHANSPTSLRSSTTAHGNKASIPVLQNSSDIANSILSRAKADASSSGARAAPSAFPPRRRFGQSSKPTPALTHPTHPPRLHRATTSSFENLEENPLPAAPSWVTSKLIYSCLRSTPADPANGAFLKQLYTIKMARQLTLDDIGVRAYSTSIAAIAAYPYVIASTSEILRLPGCDQKIATLWSEWIESADRDDERSIQTVRELENDEDLKHLQIFYAIWGVGADTARRFYFEHGWQDIDDLVEFGWSTLNRVQQIGVKFYDDFQSSIPRPEVESIADIVHRHARSCRGVAEHDWGTPADVVCVIVGGYRRGKLESGDVDVILSHRREDFTHDLVIDVVASLEQEGYITHTLTLNTTTSDRAQQTLPYRTGGGGHGFDSLDKALCVWQDPEFDAAEAESAIGAKNPNVHRRVDIIISPWRCVGAAVLGWSGATTFQRDIRRWCKRQKGWKFDSSGVRDRATGMLVDFESPRGEDQGDEWQDRERRLMEGLGIGWRSPTERCTG